jgi:hypothetical protein
MFSEQHAAEVDRLIRQHGYDRLSPAVTPRDAADKRNTVMFSPVRPSNLGQGTEAELTGPADAMLTHADIEGACAELAAMHPKLDRSDIEAALLTLSAGERDLESLAAAALELAAYDTAGVAGLTLAAFGHGDVSEADRRAAAARGHALADGSYPITHAGRGPGSLHSAAVLAASGHGNVAAARKLIRKMAAQFGVDVATLPGMASGDDEDLKEDRERARGTQHARRRRGQRPFSDHGTDGKGGDNMDTGGPSGDVAASHVLMRKVDGSYGTIALTPAQEYQLGLAAAEDDGDHGYYLDLAADEFGTGAAQDARDELDARLELDAASAWGTPSSYRTPFKVHDVGARDGGNPTDERSAAEIARLLKAYPNQFRGPEKPYGSSNRYPPGSLAARRRGEEHSLAGGRPQAWSR